MQKKNILRGGDGPKGVPGDKGQKGESGFVITPNPPNNTKLEGGNKIN